MPLLTPRAVFRPFEYDWAFDAYLKQNQAHWLPTEVPMSSDMAEYRHSLSDSERNLITQVLRFFTQGDLEVQNNYQTRLIPYFQIPEISMMLSSFAAIESIHVHAYAYLIDSLGLPESEFAAFLNYGAMRAKFDYLHTFKTESHRDLAKTLAIFGALMEGTALFASFAILMNFPRQGKLRGLGQIITWSIRDESCVATGSEILTTRGWVDFRELNAQDKVAQYNMGTGEVSFVLPSRIIRKPYKGPMHSLRNQKGGIDQLLTPDHDVISTANPTAKWSKIKAQQFKPNVHKYMPLSGHALVQCAPLSALDRFRIAFQADGHLPTPDRYTGELCGTLPVMFTFAKERKIERMTKLLAELGWEYKTTPRPSDRPNKADQIIFRIAVPANISLSKRFDTWVHLGEIGTMWANDFLEEVRHWDGHTPKDPSKQGYFIYYSSVIAENVDTIQALASLCGRHATRSVQVDNRSPTYSDVHRTWIHDTDKQRCGCVTNEIIDYDGEVHCVTVPTGAFVMRYKGKVSITGNCHADSICKLYRTLVDENPHLLSEGLEAEIIEAARHMIDMEDAFIDTCFEMGAVRGLDAQDVKAYVRYICDMRLADLRLEPIFNQDGNPLPWLSDMLNAKSHENFFETKATDYSKANIDDTWPR